MRFFYPSPERSIQASNHHPASEAGHQLPAKVQSRPDRPKYFHQKTGKVEWFLAWSQEEGMLFHSTVAKVAKVGTKEAPDGAEEDKIGAESTWCRANPLCDRRGLCMKLVPLLHSCFPDLLAWPLLCIRCILIKTQGRVNPSSPHRSPAHETPPHRPFCRHQR